MRHRARPVRPASLLAAGLVALLSLGVLAGCRTNVGTAATVGSTRITDSDVGDYLLSGGPAAASSTSAAASSSAASTPAAPKTTVLDTLIQQDVFTRTLEANGGIPSEADLVASRDSALEAQTGQATYDQKAFSAEVTKLGLTQTFLPVFLRTLELRQALSARAPASDPGAVVLATLESYVTAHQGQATEDQLKQVAAGLGSTEAEVKKNVSSTTIGLPADLQQGILQALAASHDKGIVDLVSKLGITVSVSPRYGSWNATTLGLTGASAPSYLSVVPTATPATAAPSATPTQ